MQNPMRPLAFLVACTLLAGSRLASGQSGEAIPASLLTPNRVESRIGTLEFQDGAPNKATLDKVYDHLDYTHALR